MTFKSQTPRATSVAGNGKTIKVLSLDGGGVRGIITSRLLELFCDLAGIPGNKIYQYFDIIAGTSIGGIQALGYAKGLTPTYVKQLLIDNASTIFNCTYPVPGGGQAGKGKDAETILKRLVKMVDVETGMKVGKYFVSEEYGVDQP